jgi:hypothetical protein
VQKVRVLVIRLTCGIAPMPRCRIRTFALEACDAKSDLALFAELAY